MVILLYFQITHRILLPLGVAKMSETFSIFYLMEMLPRVTMTHLTASHQLRHLVVSPADHKNRAI